ncbi:MULTISPECIES: hypothetical protein [Citrobacter freundii complex]|uniref:hypothetical protein n=1 Tax=Citrobacter freundii complex TaxID=1344959 RepID=UPI000CDBD368|nr:MULTISPECIES: hypothetical protein [Citrobacter freundii complex]AUZ69928.1 hypothetical protein C2U41_11525 [Citrobacter freundii complex sp. CFNIH4]POU14147.1 hypothetical protein C3381_15150 [Citrobacter freundii complex sp. CFNIH6]POU15714.1 hypothetical protein C3368_01555 [Citrobacter freundii complex sp. CFNIH7]QLR82428.1 hypothetical protein HV333_11065 [Citrobacter freundii]HCB1504978.1 hypothetical protein [Citrobacter freundii]
MANDALNQPVILRATSLVASSLPIGSSPAYQQYILSQALDFTNVANKANEAGDGAYDAQVRNDQQDVQLLDHEIRLGDAEAQIQNHETRITSAEAAIVSLDGRVTAAESDIEFLTNELIAVQGDIADLQTDVSSLQSDVSNQGVRLTQAETDIDDIQADYVSKTAIAAQSLASSLGVATSFSIDGVKVLGPKQTGWTAGTGSPNLGVFNADQSFTVGAAYSQTEVQAIATELIAARKRILALEQALRTHGLIN